MFKKLLGVMAGLLLFGGVCLAEDSDITITKANFGDKYYKEVTWFSAYNVGDDTGTAYDYNEQQGATDDDGLVDARMHNLAITIQVDVITLASASIDVRVEGRAGSAAEWGEIYTYNFAAVTGANNAFMIPVGEYVEEIRVGVKANATVGTDSITITGILLGDGK